MAPQSGMPSPMASQRPPYAPKVWALGGAPNRSVDIPAQTIFMILFLIGAAVHMRIFRQNKSRGHKFIPNMCMFVVCTERVITSIVRIASVCNPTNVSLSIAAQMFVAAGVVVLIVINLIFAMRLVRSTHPSVGWHPAFGTAFKFIIFLLIFTIVTVISASVESFFTLNKKTQATTRGLQRYGATFLAIAATLPLPVTFLTLTIPYSPLDRFGIGRLRTKVITLIISATLLSLGAWYRCGIILQTPTPRTEPLPSYLGKGAYYFFNFIVEIVTIYMYAILRVDLRWHIPNGAKGPGSYSRPLVRHDVEKQGFQGPPSDRTGYDTQSLKTITEDEEEDVDTTEEQVQWPLPPPRIIEIDLGNSSRTSLAPPDPDIRRTSGRNSYIRPKTGDRSSRGSILSERFSVFMSRQRDSLPVFASSDQKRRWRESEEARIVRRLGGPWQQLPDPIESSSLRLSKTETRGSSRPTTARSAGSDIPEPPSPAHFRSTSDAPTLPDIVSAGGWTPRIDWEFKSPQRFLSLKRRTLLGLNIAIS